jgi:SAM-dependent methyltransferase
MPDIKNALAGVTRVQGMDLHLDSHHYIVLSHLYRWLREHALPVANGVMLDYGCGGQPYKELFSSKVTRYIGADVAAAKDTVLDLELHPSQPVPLPSHTIDTILANQTLEHVPDPDFYLGECCRLLRPGGVLILTAPMQWRHHEVPFDFFRFTRFGLLHLLAKHGFEVKELTPSGGVYSLLGQIWLNHLNERGVHYKVLYRCINSMALWLDRKIPDFEDTINWMCIAVRTATP